MVYECPTCKLRYWYGEQFTLKSCIQCGTPVGLAKTEAQYADTDRKQVDNQERSE